MKNISILPADTYTVINKTVINDSDRKIVSMLYQPIIGFTAVSLYLTLLDEILSSAPLIHKSSDTSSAARPSRPGNRL